MTKYVQFSDSTHTVVVGVYGGPQPEGWHENYGEVEDDDPRYLAYVEPWNTPAGKAAAARAERDSQLRTIYDPGILMAQRALRLASTPEEVAYAEGKILELDTYAEALAGIPEQPGFPQTVVWPAVPTK